MDFETRLAAADISLFDAIENQRAWGDRASMLTCWTAFRDD